ncbi:SET domain protein [Onchocerca flexuosa]|uniref:SET domain protein n=1 Tax=Onchocerca flexuosa TaxID=387005 RepID=A0A238BYA0_9BILA|nr:SET domain protein [Onchocerca flexuosa]
MEYVQINSLECGPGGSSANFETVYEGCSCTGPCTASIGCTCLLYKQDIFKDQNSIKNINNILPILECSARCSCSFFANNCENRCVQFGASLPLEARLQKRLKKKVRVFDAGEKGYGLQCREQIKKGRFVIEYIGEVIGSDEVEKRRSKTNYVLTVKEIFRDHTELTYIDPSVRGNQSRFINHGCNPNLVMILVRYGTPQVHVGLFALRDIPAYEELTYDYGASTSEFCLKKCLCGSTDCRLFLPASIS